MSRLFFILTLIFLSLACTNSHAQAFNYHLNMQNENLHDFGVLLKSTEETSFPVSFDKVKSWQSNLEVLEQRALFGGRYWLVSELINHCLLYTSPSPRDRQKSRMPSSA